MSDERLWPKTPLIDAYLEATHANYWGHSSLDYAVLLSIVQNFANRRYITVGDYHFNVHLLVTAPQVSWVRNAIDFGFKSFLSRYFEDDDISATWLTRFLQIDGQNTVAGLMDAINTESDDFQRQTVTLYTQDARSACQTSHGVPQRGDMLALQENILQGRANHRRVREAGRKKSESILHPRINALWGIGQAEAPPLLELGPVRLFLPVLATEPDRQIPVLAHMHDRVRLHTAFSQLLNFLDMHAGNPREPSRMQVTAEANEQLVSTIRAEKPDSFLTVHRQDLVLLAGIHALMRLETTIEPQDVSQAVRFIQAAQEAYKHLVRSDQHLDLTTTQRQRTTLLERLQAAIEESAKAGVSKSELYKRVPALTHLKRTEREELIAELDDEDMRDVVFALDIEASRHRTERRFFSCAVWSKAEAALQLPIAKPIQQGISEWIDVLGIPRARLEDCHGFRPEWLES